MQFSQRFVADQRWDLPQYDSMIGLISQEFYNYNQFFFSPSNSIVKGWNVLSTGGLTVALDQSITSVLFNTSRAGNEEYIVWPTTAAALTLTLANNATNYVEVQIISSTCAPDTVAIWDSSTNVEFAQSVNTENQQQPVLVSNTTAFTGLPDHLPLAIVVTTGGAISSIDNTQKPYLYHVGSDWNFGTPRTDTTIDNNIDAYYALATALREGKGTTNWFDIGWSSIANLKEAQNTYFYGGGTIAWNGTSLTWSATMSIDVANRAAPFTIAAGSATLTDGQAMYVVIPTTGSGTVLTPVIAAISAVPINPTSSGFAPGIQVMFLRRGTTIYAELDLPDLIPGESSVIGQHFTTPVAARLGVTSDSTFEAYGNTNFILTADDYPTAISKLDARALVAQTISNQNQTMRLINGGSWSFVASTGVLTWSATANVMIPGLADSVNAISAGSIALSDGQVAYVTVNRSGSGGSITLSVAAVASFTPGDNIIVLARRIGNLLFVGVNSWIILLHDGEMRTLMEGGYLTTITTLAGTNLTANQSVYISPGTGVDSSLTAGSAYPTDAGATNGAIRSQFVGFVTSTVTSGASCLIITGGMMPGFTGLTFGAIYYLNPSVIGGVTATRPTTSNQYLSPIGIASSTTVIDVSPTATSQILAAVGVGLGAADTVAITPPTAFNITSGNNGQILLVNSALGAITLNLPNPSLSGNLIFTVKDYGGNFNTNACTLHRFGSENIELLAADFVMQANGGIWTFSCDSTNWMISAR